MGDELGGGGAEEDFSKLSIDQLIEHKSAKARQIGFEQCKKLFDSLDADDNEFNKYMGSVKKFASDSNVMALEKGLDALLTFVEVAKGSAKTAGEICPILVQKCIANARKKVADKAQEILLMYIEVEKPDLVMEALSEGLSNKNPKVVIGVLQTLNTAVAQFGPKPLGVKGVAKQISKLLEHANAEVRNQTKAMTVEIYRWIGDVLKPQLQNLKPIQDTELNVEFEKTKDGEKPTPTRYLRSQRPVASSGASTAAEPTADGAAGGPAAAVRVVKEEIDPWDLLDPVDVLARLPANFQESVDSKKWTERKDGLQALSDLLTANPRLDQKANYGDMVGLLKKVLGKDANINVQAVAAKCLHGIASGLRKKFAPYAVVVAPTIFEKFKEKKPLLRDPLVECIDAVAASTTLEVLSDEIVVALGHQNPNIKIQTDLFLQRLFRKHNQQTLPKKLLKNFTPALVKHTADPDPEVRDAAYAALGSAMKAIGEKPMLSFLSDIVEDKIKMAKIKEFYETAVKEAGDDVVTMMVQSVHKTNDPVHLAAPPAGSANNASDDDGDQPSSNKSSPLKPTGGSKAASGAAAASATRTTPVKKAPAAAAAAKGSSSRSSSVTRKPGETTTAKKKEGDDSFSGGALIVTNEKQKRFVEENKLKVLRWNFTGAPEPEHLEQLKLQLSTVCKPALHAQLFHPDFKQHLKALEAMQASIQVCPDAVLGASDLLLKWVTLRFFDTNPSVLLKCLDFVQALLQLFSESNEQLSDNEVNAFVPYLLLKAGEPKDVVRQGVRVILERVCELYSASKVFPLLLEGTKTKNSRQKAECLEQIGLLIQVYTLSVCGPPGPAMKAIAQCIGDRDNTVRNAALNAIVAAWQYEGEKVFKMIGNISDKDFAMLEERIKRTAKSKPLIKKPPPRDPKAVKGGTTNSAAERERQKPASDDEDRRPEPQGQEERKPLTSRPRSSGMFQMDLESVFPDEAERSERAAGQKSKLIDLSDLDQMMNKPLDLPTRSSLINRPLSPAKRTPSMTSVSSMDASVALDSVISQIGSSSMSTAIQAVVQLEELVRDTGKLFMVSGKIDQILTALYFQLRIVYNTHMTDESADKRELVQLYRSLCAMLLSLVNVAELAREATDGPLKDLACQLLTVLLDERLKSLPDGNHVIRSINVITVKLVERCDPTACYIALSRLLRESLSSHTASLKFQELVMKCIWKQSRLLPQLVHQMQLNKVLYEAHQFFCDFPGDSWRDKPSDMPLRTVKTVLNAITKAKGDAILDHVGLINQPHQSEAVAYVKKCLREGHRQQNLPGQVEDQPTPAASNVLSDVGNRMTTSTTVNYTSQLAEIFKLIANKEKTKQGIRELYDFLSMHPGAQRQVQQQLDGATPFFKSYVERGLADCAAHAAKNGDSAPSNAAGSAVIGSARLPSNGAMNGEPIVKSATSAAALDRLQEMRAKMGLGPAPIVIKRSTEEEVQLPSVRTTPQKVAPTAAAASARTAESPTRGKAKLSASELDAYKRRLEQVKRGSQLQ
uniref:TOG domain-containing protein n=1 Tax=Plectus sambesii TaxID=2011161 RepID=A0A914V058_9BILA